LASIQEELLLTRRIPYQAILFDCDGVLVDNEPITLDVLRQYLKDLGLALSIDGLASSHRHAA
jgi:beta-phosphoglucomutase-like phosphatase (HAD superfamily)